jgi:hypothetical protein
MRRAHDPVLLTPVGRRRCVHADRRLVRGRIHWDGPLRDILAKVPGATLEAIFQQLTGSPAVRAPELAAREVERP